MKESKSKPSPNPVYLKIKNDILGKNRTKWVIWLVLAIAGYWLADFINVAPAPFTIMCGGIVAALLSYLGMETGKESKAKEVEESVFKDAEEQYLKYLERSNEVIRECEASKSVYFFDQALQEKEEALAQLQGSLDAVENFIEQYGDIGSSAIVSAPEFDIVDMQKYRDNLVVQRDAALKELYEVFESSEELSPEANEKKEELKVKHDVYLDCYSDLQSSLDVLKEVHNRGGEKIQTFKRKVAEYDEVVDGIFMDTLNPRKGELVLNHVRSKKKVYSEYVSLKSEIYRRVEYTSDAYAIKNSIVLSVVIGAVCFAAGYNYNYGENHKNESKVNVVELRFYPEEG